MSAMELDAKKIMPATWCPPGSYVAPAASSRNGKIAASALEAPLMNNATGPTIPARLGPALGADLSRRTWSGRRERRS